MKGLILAAGKGSRLRPLTYAMPKALISIRGRPLITYPILSLKDTGIKDIGIVIREKDYPKFKSNLKFPGLKINYIFQKKPNGSARAIECAHNFVGNNTFLLCWCDFLSPFKFKKLIKEHLRFNPSATILINKEKNPSGTAQVLYKGRYITRIEEKPIKRFSYWGSTGSLVLKPLIFSALSKIIPSAKGEYNIADALQYLVEQGQRVRFLKIDTWRININRPRDLKLARAKILSCLDNWGL